MRRQLGRLVDASELRSVTLQVIPFSGGAHAALYASIFDHLRAAALDPAESVRTLAAIKDELREHERS
jgi:Domain of unknown function (DUF5753)